MAAAQERWECPNCGTPLNIATLGIYAKVACPACGHVDHVHSMLANFRIEGVLGLGGMSVVLRARDLVLERPLAIKLLNEFYRDQPERIARFEQECELMAKVRHENVVSVYSAGREKGQFYIAMELINGRNLEELVHEQGPMEPDKALEVVRQVVLGLDAANKAGLLHRDMKPGNIIICEDGKAKVLDFGLSLGKRDENTEEIIWATPFYVPPETLMREPEDTRTDIYALGMTLHHLLTGQENFEPAPEGIEDMLECKRHLPRMAEVMPELPEPYCDLIDHMTGYDPVSRPAGYKALLVEIDEVRAHLAALRRGASVGSRLQKLQTMLGGVAGTLALGCAAAALTAYLFTPEPEHQYITPPVALEWHECEALATAMEQLQGGQVEQAAATMRHLADSDGEATACAWAALHSLIFTYLNPDAEARRREFHYFYGRFIRNVQRMPAPAGQEFHAEMTRIVRADDSLVLPSKVLQAALCFTRLQPAVERGQKDKIHKHLQDACAALRGAGAGYGRLVELLPQEDALCSVAPQPEQHTPVSSNSTDISERCARAVAELRMADAERILAEMETQSGGDANLATLLTVQKEALSLFREACEMMRRLNLTPEPGEELTTVRLQEILSRLDEPTLSVEIATLMLMAQGYFEDAAALDPHADDSESREPFAVLMRDWKTRFQGK